MSKKIAFFVFDGFQFLDFSGVCAVFEMANLCSGENLYSWDVLSKSGGLVKGSNLVSLDTESVQSKVETQYDLCFVVGGDRESLQRAASDNDTISDLVRLCKQTQLKCSVCSGAFLLAVIGLLDDRNVTTHWVALEELKALFPRLNIQDDVLYTIDQDTATSAGVTTGIDLALELLSIEFGRKLANKVAKRLVVSIHRPGTALQQPSIYQQNTQDELFKALFIYLQNNISRAVEVEDMATFMNMSVRNFSRKFKETYKISPAQLFIQLKLEHAKLMLSRGYNTNAVASATGYKNPQSLNRLFEKHLGQSLVQYQKFK